MKRITFWKTSTTRLSLKMKKWIFRKTMKRWLMKMITFKIMNPIKGLISMYNNKILGLLTNNTKIKKHKTLCFKTCRPLQQQHWMPQINKLFNLIIKHLTYRNQIKDQEYLGKFQTIIIMIINKISSTTKRKKHNYFNKETMN